MKRISFLFLLAALMVPLFAAKTGAVDLKKDRTISDMPGPGDFSVTVGLLGEQEGVYRPGKEIRISFQTTKDAYVVVYNIDSDGYVQLLYPEDGRPVMSKGRTTYFLPPPGKNLVWEAGGTTGVEYIHALAVTDQGRLNEDELYFLSQGDRLPEEKRLRVDSDPYLAFNTIDEEIVRDAESDPPATDFTNFYINRRVDYPRYLCSKCHSPGKLPDPYAMECPEIVIEEISYEEKPQFPYPPLYDVRHAGDQAGDEDYSSDGYAEDWLDEGDTDSQYRMTISYSTYNPYAPYYGPTLLFWDPFYYDPFWWGFGWSWTWGYGYYPPSWYYYPYYRWAYNYRYPWWGWHDDWYCGGYGHWRGDDHRFRPVYAQRELLKRKLLNYSATNTALARSRSIAGSRLVQTKNRDLARTIDRSELMRRSVDRNLVSGTIRGDRTGSVRNRETDRKIIYGGDRTIGATGRTADGRSRTVDTRRTRETAPRRATGTERRAVTPRAPSRRDTPVRERSGDSGRTVDRRSEPRRTSGDSGGRETTRDRSSGSTTRERSKGGDRKSSSASNGSSARANSAPSRASAAPARSAGRAPSAPPASSRAANAAPARRTRSR
jgi:hypothetical protein